MAAVKTASVIFRILPVIKAVLRQFIQRTR